MFRKRSAFILVLLSFLLQASIPVDTISDAPRRTLPNGSYRGWILLKASRVIDFSQPDSDSIQVTKLEIPLATGQMAITSTNKGVQLSVRMAVPLTYLEKMQVAKQNRGVGGCDGYTFDGKGQGNVTLKSGPVDLYPGDRFTPRNAAIFKLGGFSLNVQKEGEKCWDPDTAGIIKGIEAAIRSIYDVNLEFQVKFSTHSWSGNCTSPGWSNQPGYTFHCMWFAHKLPN